MQLSLYALNGDINHDGIVDGYDLILLARAFGSRSGDRHFNIYADLTASSTVDGEDLSILASNFGKRGNDNCFQLIVNSGKTYDSDFSSLTEKTLPYSSGNNIQRYKYVDIANEVTTGKGISHGDRILLNLFDDSRYYARIDRINTNINGTLAIRARIENLRYGYCIISTTDGMSLSSINMPERNEYYIITNIPGENIHILMEVDAECSAYLQESNPLLPPSETDFETSQQESIKRLVESAGLGPEDYASIDMMVVYTPAAASWASNNGGIDNIISQAIEKAQLTLENSMIKARANLVWSSRVDYTESGSSAADLYRFTASAVFNPFGEYYDGYLIPGYMDEIHEWRDTSGADLCSLFAYVDDTGGLGFLLNTASGRPQYGFSLTRVQQAGFSYTHIHETGHNMGAHHPKDQLESPGPGLFSYSAGWRWTGDNNGKYCSVMTYSSGEYFADGVDHVNVAYFSNPEILHYGAATGHPQDGDNARTLREVKHVVAEYRNTSGRPPDAPSDVGVTVTGPNSVRIAWNDNSTNESGFEIEMRIKGDDDYHNIGSTGSNITSFSYSGITSNNIYYFRVRAYNDIGYSEYAASLPVAIGMGW